MNQYDAGRARGHGLFSCPGKAGKENNVARHFMSGTKYAAFERMMMEPRKYPKDCEPQKKKNYPRKGSREKQRSK